MMKKEPSRNPATTAATSWRAERAAEAGAAVVVAVSGLVGSVVDIAVQPAAVKEASEAAVKEDLEEAEVVVSVGDAAAFAVPLEAGDRHVEVEVVAVAAVVVAALVATMAERAAPSSGTSPNCLADAGFFSPSA